MIKDGCVGKCRGSAVEAACTHRWEINTGEREHDKIRFKVRGASFPLFDLKHSVIRYALSYSQSAWHYLVNPFESGGRGA